MNNLLRKAPGVLILLLIVAIRPGGSSEALHPIKLLEGYSIRQDSAVDATAWTIERKGGPIVHFESGFSEGLGADPKQASSYAWSRVQDVHGRKVLFALVKPGVTTRWEADKAADYPLAISFW